MESFLTVEISVVGGPKVKTRYSSGHKLQEELEGTPAEVLECLVGNRTFEYCLYQTLYTFLDESKEYLTEPCSILFDIHFGEERSRHTFQNFTDEFLEKSLYKDMVEDVRASVVKRICEVYAKEEIK